MSLHCFSNLIYKTPLDGSPVYFCKLIIHHHLFICSIPATPNFLLLESTLLICTLGLCTRSALGSEEFAFLPSTHQYLAWGKRITHGCKNWETLTVWLGRVSFGLNNNKLSSRQAMAGRVSQRCHLGPRLSPLPALQPLQPSCFATS